MTARLALIGPQPRIAVDVEGEGELVLFLHGIGGNRTSWRDQLGPIGAHYRAAAWDARGYGASDDYPGPLAFSDFSDDLLRVLDWFGAASAHIVGLSMGGRIALDFYQRHPDRVQSLVLVDTSAGHPSATNPADIEAALKLRMAPLLEGKTPADIAPDVARKMIGPDISDDAYALLIDNLSALRTESYIKTLQCVTRYSDFPDYASIAVPTLVVNGADDPIAKPEVARRLAMRIPDHRFVLLERTGHVSNIERPDLFNSVLLDFLHSVQAGAARPQLARAAT